MPDQPTLCKLIEDVSRFARIFATTIELHPLLVYLGALPFTPVNSILYQRFSDADLPQIVGGYEQSWSSLSHVENVHKIELEFIYWSNRILIVSVGSLGLRTFLPPVWVGRCVTPQKAIPRVTH
jgi:hypothetical protein